ncbi:hypothetical protein BGX31_003593 [Mortierella sp. GBA43]|nr:hypothetical protein BGX31_003593 [Mortierella sp. GBA43]
MRAATLLAAAIAVLAPTAHAQDHKILSLTFHNEAGGSLGQQTIPYAECTPLTQEAFASVTSTDSQAALNLYEDRWCQTVVRSTVGEWSKVEEVQGVITIRWEGTAPSDRAPGSLSTDAFPEKMFVQKPISGPDAWVMDPAKGKMVVILVAAVLLIGIMIGSVQVYRAAQYTPPPKKPKKQTGLNVKKIKKKDAYFKKPPRNDAGHSFQRLNDDSTIEHSARNSQHSEAATFVEWQQQQRSMNNNKGYGADSISIDMRETRSSPPHGRSGSSNLIRFDSDISPAYHGSGNNNRGRGGEVLVPMHTFDNNNYQHPRSPVRRPSNSRSR